MFGIYKAYWVLEETSFFRPNYINRCRFASSDMREMEFCLHGETKLRPTHSFC